MKHLQMKWNDSSRCQHYILNRCCSDTAIHDSFRSLESIFLKGEAVTRAARRPLVLTARYHGDWHFPQNTRTGRATAGISFSQMRAGSS